MKTLCTHKRKLHLRSVPTCLSSFRSLWFYRHRCDRAMQKFDLHTFASWFRQQPCSHWNTVSLNLKFSKTYVSFLMLANWIQVLRSFPISYTSFQNFQNHDLLILLFAWLRLSRKCIFEMTYVFYSYKYRKSPNTTPSSTRTHTR